jgi:hypothetical protein
MEATPTMAGLHPISQFVLYQDVVGILCSRTTSMMILFSLWSVPHCSAYLSYIFGLLKESGTPDAALGNERGLAIEDGSADVSPFVRALR